MTSDKALKNDLRLTSPPPLGILKIMSKVYTKIDQIEHVLLRSSMYVGSKTLNEYTDFVGSYDVITGNYAIRSKQVVASPAILRFFIEVLSNAVDNVHRSKSTATPCTKIKVNIDQESGEIRVWNDGDVIPVEKHAIEGIYNHSLIFGQLLTGSNYDDTEAREISGTNGVGIKCTNVFSSTFTVRGVDPNNCKSFEQTWTNNMRSTSTPTIKKTKLVSGFTEVKYILDFERLGITQYTDDIVGIYLRYVIDAAMLTGVNVYFNDKLIKVRDLLAYARLYEEDVTTTKADDDVLSMETPHAKIDYVHIISGDVQAVITTTNTNDFKHFSFTNGIYNRLGGKHVDSVCDALFKPILEKFTKKNKPLIKLADIKKFFKVFVVCVVQNPEFDSQSKERLESPKVKFEVTTNDIKKILSWAVVEDIENMLKMKEMLVLKKVEKKQKGYVKIDGYDPANNAGGKRSEECSLILCEGLSAKTFAVAGISKGLYGKVGRDWFGILSLTGKILNSRNVTPTVMSKNAVLINLIQAIGLKFDADYTDDAQYGTLNYGRILMLTDADVDGVHISSLVINFIHHMCPSLLHRATPFIISMATPIVRVFGPKGKDILFYDENKFKKYATEQTSKFKSKYYKGLGTTKIEDVPDTFGTKMIQFITDEKLDENINKVFHKKFADERKAWLETYEPNPSYSLDDRGVDVDMNLSDYLNFEMIKFSHDDCKRSIPNLYDGLKISQRKVLYAVKKRNITYGKPSLKVAQLGGYVAEHTNYHHGEQNLYDTIIKMAQCFPGSNNIPLLYRDGAFGTRLSLGKDAASPRYIFTKMELMTPLLFREDDDVLLNHVEDDGDVVEPFFYVPILPLVLINGALGIGSGWSSTIPCFNPLDVVESVKSWIAGDDMSSVELTPWYRGFEGDVTKDGDKFITTGKLSKVGLKVRVDEIPIGMSIDKFKEFCEELVVDKKIKQMKNNSSYKKIEFVLTEDANGMSCSIKNLKLTSTLHVTNMVLFNDKDQIKKYKLGEIIEQFCKVRLELYDKRLAYMETRMLMELMIHNNKYKFIQEIIAKSLNVMNVEENVVVESLRAKKYHEDPSDTAHGFDYLLRLQVRSFTVDKLKQLEGEISGLNDKLKLLRATTSKIIWLKEIEEFLVEYKKWNKKMA